ncbi:hypothetical protein HMH01_05790 [Halovulum dunhuangense]|uniref:Uncharacterized protein n=1 Tax=Halovulum dunhuangense TaxID=1505036 RepID=A0A849L106_9RHOB|nr:hypothetical protein [Halovulum dunhuangense]NNU79947.1 hypothetical protein [Halovulum dunhuangense]
MISIEDIVGMTDLTEDEVAAIAEHEHMELAPAAALASYVMHEAHGPARIQQMICEDIREALHRDDLSHARTLFQALRHFMAQHPEAARGAKR